MWESPFTFESPRQAGGVYGVTNPETASRWAMADSAPQGTRAWRQGQAGLERWIQDQIGQATASGQLNINDSAAVDRYLATLGVTPEKGGGRYLHQKYTRGGGARSAARSALTSRYGSNLTLGGLAGAPVDPFNAW
jgi:hypothetical protein